MNYAGQIGGFDCFETDTHFLRINISQIYQTEEKVTVQWTDKDSSISKREIIPFDIDEEGRLCLRHHDEKLVTAIQVCLSEHEGMEFYAN